MNRISDNHCQFQLQNIDMNSDGEEFDIPANVCSAASHETRFSLIVRPANPRRQNLRPMIHFLPRLWGMDDSVHGRIIVNNRAQFIFPSREAMDLVIRRGPWSFNEWMIASGIWEENLPLDFPNHILFCIQFRDIPIRFNIYSIVDYIANTLGEVVETDFNLESAATREYARVRISWPLSLPLVFHRRFRFGGHTGIPITFRYERLRNYCFRCRSLCHDVTECEEPEQEVQMNPPGDDENADEYHADMVPRTDPVSMLSHPSPRLTIEASPARLLFEPPRHTEVSISEFISLNGQKISPELLKAVYDSYSQSPSSDAHHRTNGLPLIDPKD
ncbi:hypothetical protein AALP_AAs49362U000100 [Arabis alpina]|uniref:DUF4283 domain-containing protein n=1 Tax=Arabis alpina TaxID=50452 RepID=A0A087FZP8_ARAAL|nr:hypothetical protein AALP_AAs49362U000100 [Arabis alpina]